jgi:phospholipid-binding lipoprotein MlaA
MRLILNRINLRIFCSLTLGLITLLSPTADHPSYAADLNRPYQVRLGPPRGASVFSQNPSITDSAVTIESQLSGGQYDPLEPINRFTFAVNLKADQWAIKPVAQAYRAVIPTPVRTGVQNVFGNVADLWTSANNLMQGKVREARTDATRVVINSTIGVVGVIDLASDWGYQKHKEDFGQTLGAWGVPAGPYIVLPLLGPSTLRDSVAQIGVDMHASPFRYLADPGARNSITAVRLTESRSRLLDREKALQGIALDQYLFVRDAYLQRRQAQVLDGRSTDD